MKIPAVIIKALLLLLAGLYLYSLYHRQPHTDDCWLGEHAWYQAHNGYVKSELMHGVTKQEQRVLVHHKLLTLHGALAIKLFGFSVTTLKSISLFYYLLFLGLFYGYVVRYRRLFNLQEFMFLLLLLGSFPLIFEYSDVFRPEVPMMFYGFLSFVFMEESIRNRRRTFLLAVLSGLAAGMCVAIHLNGVIFIGAGSIILMLHKRYRQGALFLVFSLIAASLYFYDFAPGYGFRFWLYQITGSPFHERTGSYFGIQSVILEILSEHQRFFHSAVESSLSLIIIYALYKGWTMLRRIPTISMYCLLLVLLMAAVAIYKTSKYVVVYLPVVMIMIMLIFKDKKVIRYDAVTRKYIFDKILLFLVVLYLGISFSWDVMLSIPKFTAKENRAITEKYIREPSRNLVVAAPMDFVFNEIEHYGAIQSLLMYREYQRLNPGIRGAGFLRMAAANGNDYLVLKGNFITELGMEGFRKDSVSEGYRVIAADPGIMVLRRESPAEKEKGRPVSGTALSKSK